MPARRTAGRSRGSRRSRAGGSRRGRARSRRRSAVSSSIATAAAGSASRASADETRSELTVARDPFPRAAPMYVQSTVWSLSWMSIVSQAKLRWSTSDQSASSDVLPNPGGATTSASEGRDSASRFVRRARRTVPGRRRACVQLGGLQRRPASPGRPRSAGSLSAVTCRLHPTCRYRARAAGHALGPPGLPLVREKTASNVPLLPGAGTTYTSADQKTKPERWTESTPVDAARARRTGPGPPTTDRMRAPLPRATVTSTLTDTGGRQG